MDKRSSYLHPDATPTQLLSVDALGKILQQQDFYHVKVADPLSHMKV